MNQFIEFCVKTFIKDAEKHGNKQKMLQIFREETDEELAARVASTMEGLEISFVMKTGEPLFVNSRIENATTVVQELKKKLAPELTKQV